MSGPSIAESVAEIVPMIYAAAKLEFGYHPNTDVSRGDKCHAITTDMLHALGARGMGARRELHQIGGDWHYVIAHSPKDRPPTENDVITDLTPWACEGGEEYTGYLHGPRADVMATLRAADLHEEYVSLRGLATITKPHDERIWPHSLE